MPQSDKYQSEFQKRGNKKRNERLDNTKTSKGIEKHERREREKKRRNEEERKHWASGKKQDTWNSKMAGGANDGKSEILFGRQNGSVYSSGDRVWTRLNRIR